MFKGSKSLPYTTFVFAVVAVLCFQITAAPPSDAEVFASAKAKAKLVADDYLSRNILPNASAFNYFDACSYYGACLYAAAVNDSSYYKSIYTKYKNNKPASIPTGDVDKNSSGLLPLYLFTLSNDSSLLKLGKAAADASLQNKGYPRTAVDDTYMTGALMIQAYRATHDTAYLNFCAEYITTYKDKLQQANGLYWHKLDSKNFWGRGNGWGAASYTELLQMLPKTHSQYAAVLDGFNKQMKGLLAVQQEGGMWMQLLDSKDSKNWIETSGTAMFLFAMFAGIKNGWLDEATFLEPAKKGWAALVGYLQGAKLTNVAAGFWPSTGQPGDYLNASRGQPGDSHGTAAFLWAASAAIQLFTPTVISNQQLPAALPIVKYTSSPRTAYDLLGRSLQLEHTIPEATSSPVGGIIIHRSDKRSNRTLVLPY